MRKKYEKVGYVYIFPALLFMLFFVGYPILYNIIISFQDVNLMSLNTGIKPLIYFKNYIAVFRDPVFLKALFNTFLYTVVCIIFQFSIGFALALFFNQDFKLAKFIRGLIMVAWLLPITVTALNFKFMFAINGGIINYLLIGMRIINKPIEWLLGQNTAMISIIITNIWIGIPFNMILLVTGLGTVPKTIYESAKIDGAVWYQRLFYITLPSIKPAIFSVITLGFINTFKVFDLVFIMTNGGPINATEVLSTLAYRYSFDIFNFGKGAAVANVLCIILVLVSVVYIKYVNQDEVI
ncbi:carbohydrate ABC transporter permease [Oceanivirga salmonicida]|uniref:carbohydrate ABC transporter permease n=1 Tax=Oceanivirga salmonicida TaxID=1769291 RepID=UPI0012E25D2C|nr:sugar ABC transporter permease [Oceanivirga salmonicida]